MYGTNFLGQLLMAGVDVLIAIFYDFRQFLAKISVFLLKPHAMQKLAAHILSPKAIFLLIFGRKYFKNHHIGPWPTHFKQFVFSHDAANLHIE
jgi:hypothetical protein